MESNKKIVPRLVITDAMNMGAIAKNYDSGIAAKMAVKAGVDMVLMPSDFQAAYSGLYTAVRSGEISEAAKIYKKFGRDDKYYRYLESTLSKDSKPYLELAEYYFRTNERKAIEIAELARKKCNDRDLTGIYIFLVKAYKDKDNEYIQKLVKSAKARQMVDENAVLAAMTEQMVRPT